MNLFKTVWNRRAVAGLLVALMCLAPNSARCLVGEETKSQDAGWADEALRWGRAEAASYKITLRTEPDAPAKLMQTPVLRWSNPDSSTVHGNVFLWIHHGRPMAAASIYKFFTGKQEFAAEFLALATEPLLAKKKGQVVWQPEAAGIKLVDVPDAAAPAATATQRLRQMRDLAGQFSAASFRWEDDEKITLRLLTTPLYRYAPEANSDFIDGAVFALVTGTDPEVLVLLEARQSGDKSVWQYGLARMTSGRLKVMHREAEIWNLERVTFPAKEAHPVYRVFVRLPPPELLPIASDQK